MTKSMSLSARRELMASVRQKYDKADWTGKGKILDGFVAATEYDRKYAIGLLCSNTEMSTTPVVRRSPQKYNDQVRQALVFVWQTANQICSKRLAPFLPTLVEAMERHGHLRLPADVRSRLLSISPATIDRLLRPEREKLSLAVTTTRSGSLLKNQIKVRTFADWDDVVPGFVEADLVAHCGGNANGTFLNTLTLVDISSGWLECMPLLRKSAADVIDGLRVADDLLPFKMLGVDTDCGSEFINYELLDYCEERQITFTRARTHRKNDQAHVEEKNGSVVRRLVGYDRFEGRQAWEALARLYGVLRQYVNFFQPSLKLIEKERRGAKVSKKYDKAKTPYQRILRSEHIHQAKKDALTQEYQSLDPVELMQQLKRLQDQLWQYSGSKNTHTIQHCAEASKDDVAVSVDGATSGGGHASRYYRTSKKKAVVRTWRTRKDPFENAWAEIQLRLELMPEMTAKDAINWLMKKYPGQYYVGQIRTLQRRFCAWRLEQQGQQVRMRELMLFEHRTLPPLVTIAENGMADVNVEVNDAEHTS